MNAVIAPSTHHNFVFHGSGTISVDISVGSIGAIDASAEVVRHFSIEFVRGLWLAPVGIATTGWSLLVTATRLTICNLGLNLTGDSGRLGLGDTFTEGLDGSRTRSLVSSDNNFDLEGSALTSAVADKLTNLDRALIDFDSVQFFHSFGCTTGIAENDGANPTADTIRSIGECGFLDRTNALAKVIL